MALVVVASVVEDKIEGGEGLVGAATHGSERRHEGGKANLADAPAEAEDNSKWEGKGASEEQKYL
jgi:hypothetical protein